MKAIAIAGACLLVAGYAWLVSASAIYCAVSGHMPLFTFPYAQQWIAAARWWNYTPWTTFSVTVGAFIPTLVAGLAVVIVVRRLCVDRGQKVYGTSNFDDLRQGGAQLRRRPF